MPKTPEGAIPRPYTSPAAASAVVTRQRDLDRMLHHHVDSTAQMLDWFKRGSGPSSNAGIFELYRMLAEEARSGQPRSGRLVRLRAPRGISAVQLLSGLRRNLGADGTVEMSEADAAPLLRAGWTRADAGDLPQ